jgi:hypothetical protein
MSSIDHGPATVDAGFGSLDELDTQSDSSGNQWTPERLIEYIIEGEAEFTNINTRSDLREAIWHDDTSLRSGLSEQKLIRITKTLSWEGFGFPSQDENHRPVAVPLEEVNTEVLAVLAPDGAVYQVGDRVQFSTTQTSRWGGSRSKREIEVEGRITYLGKYGLSVARQPTYSNTSGDSYRASFGETDVEVLERSSLDDYRARLTEGVDIEIPETVNGWELINKEVRNDSDLTSIPNNLVTSLQWANGDGARFSAKWRGSHLCWYLSTPGESILTDANEDDYLYEIDTPQGVTRLETIVALAKEAMNTVAPSDFQAPYDLRAVPEEEVSSLRSRRVPIEMPETVGDWVCTERTKRSVTWANESENSAWEDFTVKIDSHGGVKVYNESTSEIHDARYVEKYAPSGKPSTYNIEPVDYAWRKREMFLDNWVYGVAFMIQTSDGVSSELENRMDQQAGVKAPLRNFDHELSENPMKTMERENGTLLAYT